jgi:hypothetical protein
MARKIIGLAINEWMHLVAFFNSVFFTACVLDRSAALRVKLEAGMWTTV